jgi:condensin complex subunit 2
VSRDEHYFTSLTCSFPADASEVAASKPRREKKEAFRIDFLTPSEKDVKTLSNELFAPVTRGAGITLPNYGTVKSTAKKGGRGRKTKEEKRDTHTLPDDMHFSSRQLVTLFLKPKFSVGIQTPRFQPILTPTRTLEAENARTKGSL